MVLCFNFVITKHVHVICGINVNFVEKCEFNMILRPMSPCPAGKECVTTCVFQM